MADNTSLSGAGTTDPTPDANRSRSFDMEGLGRGSIEDLLTLLSYSSPGTQQMKGRLEQAGLFDDIQPYLQRGAIPTPLARRQLGDYGPWPGLNTQPYTGLQGGPTGRPDIGSLLQALAGGGMIQNLAPPAQAPPAPAAAPPAPATPAQPATPAEPAQPAEPARDRIVGDPGPGAGVNPIIEFLRLLGLGQPQNQQQGNQQPVNQQQNQQQGNQPTPLPPIPVVNQNPIPIVQPNVPAGMPVTAPAPTPAAQPAAPAPARARSSSPSLQERTRGLEPWQIDQYGNPSAWQVNWDRETDRAIKAGMEQWDIIKASAGQPNNPFQNILNTHGLGMDQRPDLYNQQPAPAPNPPAELNQGAPAPRNELQNPPSIGPAPMPNAAQIGQNAPANPNSLATLPAAQQPMMQNRVPNTSGGTGGGVMGGSEPLGMVPQPNVPAGTPLAAPAPSQQELANRRAASISLSNNPNFFNNPAPPNPYD